MYVYIYIYIYVYIYIYIYIYVTETVPHRAREELPGSAAKPLKTNMLYTQLAIQDSRLFGPHPLNILAPPSNYLSKNDFWATQPLIQILDSEFLLCELGVST